ncbi:uncharacterized protein LACBIDRAFT_333496 [Laccaria bicolor S238N-H82]|uniref:Predicted protein n=1 Tax=Laccaria bicolor (strain S238N-H82 / ATCC MYA-4686) TaxID=486041 RepID=B0DW37_LACBS|nr:uncharacterized protein LACBIDRAFT_333496 [Laccaria bicolor S238N-H82]EDR01110.1 predicted protein [Laccaria bicolor S238N-H82]|eukprot:XP_001888152.1 predicted protein [Laccaria bicolor S238N-H82]
MLDLIHEYDQTNYLLTCLIHIQRADGDFGAVDLLEPSAALSYFRELCSSFTDVPPDVIDNFFQDVTRLVRSQGEPAVKAHTVLREVSEKVHEILVKSKGAEAWDTAVDVIRTLDGAIIDLADLVEEAVGEDDDGKFVMYQRIKEQKAKDPGSRTLFATRRGFTNTFPTLGPRPVLLHTAPATQFHIEALVHQHRRLTPTEVCLRPMITVVKPAQQSWQDEGESAMCCASRVVKLSEAYWFFEHSNAYPSTMESTNPPLIIDDVSQSFLEVCDPVFDVYSEELYNSPIFPTDSLETDTFASLTTSGFDKDDRARLTDNYPNAYSDTYGLRSGRGFIFKTGPAWPKGEIPYGRPVPHELRPVNAHPITPVWDDILTRIETRLKDDKLPFTAVMPLTFATVGEGEPLCPLVVAIGVEPKKVAFKDAKAVAESVELILVEAGFDNVDVAIWEFETFLSGVNLPALDPVFDGSLTKFHHPFTSTLCIPVAPLKHPKCEGTLGLFLTRGDGTELLVLTAAHVARPPTMFPDNKGMSLKAAKRCWEEIIVLGDDAYARAITDIQHKVRSLKNRIPTGSMRVPSLQTRLDNGEADADGRIRTAMRTAQRQESICKLTIRQLYKLYSWVTLTMSIPSNRSIGRNKLEEQTFLDLMFPNPNDQEGYEYPEWGLLHISGVVPMDEIRYPKQLNEMGEPAMAVIKNGRSTGTTVGYVSGLKSLVRYYCKDTDIQFTSRDLTIVPYDGDPLRSAGYSGDGDSGSVIVERSGRVVGLLTAGGGRSGVADSTDVSFATVYCELEKRIKEVFPGIRLLD